MFVFQRLCSVIINLGTFSLKYWLKSNSNSVLLKVWETEGEFSQMVTHSDSHSSFLCQLTCTSAGKPLWEFGWNILYEMAKNEMTIAGDCLQVCIWLVCTQYVIEGGQCSTYTLSKAHAYKPSGSGLAHVLQLGIVVGSKLRHWGICGQEAKVLHETPHPFLRECCFGARHWMNSLHGILCMKYWDHCGSASVSLSRKEQETSIEIKTFAVTKRGHTQAIPYLEQGSQLRSHCHDK